METYRDWTDLLRALNDAGARYMVVGAHAVAYYASETRATKDFDIWVEATPENAERVWRALVNFGAPLANVKPKDFATLDMVYKMGREPQRVDILMGIESVKFANAWPRRIRASYGGVPIFIIGLGDLLRNKRSIGRPQDKLDLHSLAKRPRKSPKRRKKSP